MLNTNYNNRWFNYSHL